MMPKKFYPWSTAKLMSSLRERKELHEGLYGIFAYWVFCIIPMFNFLTHPLSEKQIYYLSSEAILGFSVAYYINQRKGGVDYLRKIICYLMPITLRLMVISLFIAIAYRVFGVSSSSREEFSFISGHAANIGGFIYLNYLIYKT